MISGGILFFAIAMDDKFLATAVAKMKTEAKSVPAAPSQSPPASGTVKAPVSGPSTAGSAAGSLKYRPRLCFTNAPACRRFFMGCERRGGHSVGRCGPRRARSGTFAARLNAAR